MPENKLSYIICLNPRSGGWVLAEALRNTGIAGFPEEWFSTSPGGTNENKLANDWGIAQPAQTGTYKEYLEKVRQKGSTANGVFGMRIQFDDFEQFPGKLKTVPEFSRLGLRDIIPAAFPNLRYVWLVRRDKVRQAISYSRAVQSDLWRQKAGVTPALLPMPVDYDVNEIARYEANFEQKDKFFADYFKLCGITPILVYYEDLLLHYEQTVRGLLIALGVEGAHSITINPSKCIRLSDATTEEWAQAYMGKDYRPPLAPAVAAATVAAPQRPIADTPEYRAPQTTVEPPKPTTSQKEKVPMRDLSEDLFKKRHALAIIQRQLASLNPKNKIVERRSNLSREEFLEQYYSANKPVILCDMMNEWKALDTWTPEYLKGKCGDVMVEISADRNKNPSYETEDGKHRKVVRFGDFIDMVEKGGETNDYYLTARNEFFKNPDVMKLLDDMVIFPQYLNPQENWMFLWYGPKGTYTPLHHDSMNIFMAQVKGRKNIKLVPSTEMDLVYNHWGVYSNVNLEEPDYERFPKLRDATVLDVMLNPGEVLFLPAGWWHSVRSLDMSITVTFMNFIFNNRFEWVHPNAAV